MKTPSLKSTETTRDRILDAAEVEFAQRGLKGASLRDIAKAARIKQPSLYKHFKSKQALYSAVFDRALRPHVDHMGAFIAAAEDAELSNERLSEMLLDDMSSRPNFSALLFHSMVSRGDEAARRIIMKWMDQQITQGQLVAKRTHPAVADADLYLISIAMTNLHHGFFLLAPVIKHFFGGSTTSPELLAMWKRLTSRVYSSLLASPPTAAPLRKRSSRRNAVESARQSRKNPKLTAS